MEPIKAFEDLLGHTITEVQQGAEEVTFTMANGQRVRFYHEQDCCESVSIDSVNGGWDSLLNSPLLAATVDELHNENPTDEPKKDYQDSWTWTTYHFKTANGEVRMRWYGESNGYYSEDVYFAVLD